MPLEYNLEDLILFIKTIRSRDWHLEETVQPWDKSLQHSQKTMTIKKSLHNVFIWIQFLWHMFTTNWANDNWYHIWNIFLCNYAWLVQENILIKNGPYILQLQLLIGQFRLYRPYISNSLILIKFAMHVQEYIMIMILDIISPISGKHVSQKLNSYECIM